MDREVRESGERIEELLEELRASAPAATVERVEELVGRVVGLYGDGLARIIRALSGPGANDGARSVVVSDPMVSSLLVLHGLHPDSVRVRVERALSAVRPYVESHGGKLVVVAIEEVLVKLRLEGTCESCSASGETATQLLERAVRDAAPEVARVEVDTGSAAKTGAPPLVAEALIQLRRSKREAAAAVVETPVATAAEVPRCDMCSAPIGEPHDHLTRVASRDLLCVCRPCWLLFEHEGTARGAYRPVSTRWGRGAWLELSDLEWAALGIPVRMAFFVVDSSRGPVGFYPSPGGAVEAAIDADAWHGLRETSRALDALEPDVEAWLLDGRSGDRFDGYLVPIDACYELVARVRMHWRGFDGGDAARAAIDEFFESVRAKALPATPREPRPELQVQP